MANYEWFCYIQRMHDNDVDNDGDDELMDMLAMCLCMDTQIEGWERGNSVHPLGIAFRVQTFLFRDISHRWCVLLEL